MPFWRRRNKQQPSSLSFHSTEQLSSSRFSVPADPLHQPHLHPHIPQRQHPPSPQPPPQPRPEQQPLRRAQTQQFPLADPDPSRSAPIPNGPDDSRKLQKKKAVLPEHAPPPSKSSSSAKDLPGLLGRSLSVKTPRSRPTNITANTTANTTATPTGLRRKDHVVTSQSIPEISMPEPDNPESPVQPRPSISTSTTTTTTTEKSPLINPSDQPHYQPYRPSSQQSLVSSLPSVNTLPSVNNTNPDVPMAADRTPGPQAQAGRQSPYPPDSKNIDQGRSTPGPSQKRDEDERSLPQKHDELLAKYSKVKRYYFEKEAQVQHLQNTVAHQRMAVSRTVLDDNEYANRFGRLDGAIKDLAFSIRKDWKSLPQWLLGYVNDDAHTVGMKEMTAIGRAFMSRWLVEEIFQRHFHPALDPTLSQQLKGIENNLRIQHVTKPVQTEEDKENAIAKISNWRRTTFDGLGDAILHGRTAEDNRAQLIEHLVSKLIATLETHLNTPPPVGMENSARMIVENAVGIAEKIPLESRDVCVEYPAPGSKVDNTLMRIEAGVPPLTNVKPENARPRPSLDQENNPAGQGSNDAESEDNTNTNNLKDHEPSPSPSTSSGPPSQQLQPQQQQPAAADAGKRKGPTAVFNQIMGKKSPPTTTAPTPTTTTTATGPPPAGKGREEEREKEAWIRFASFMSAEVRGKGPVNVLAKAPVYLLE